MNLYSNTGGRNPDGSFGNSEEPGKEGTSPHYPLIASTNQQHARADGQPGDWFVFDANGDILGPMSYLEAEDKYKAVNGQSFQAYSEAEATEMFKRMLAGDQTKKWEAARRRFGLE